MTERPVWTTAEAGGVEGLNARVSAPLLGRAGLRWWIPFVVALGFAGAMVVGVWVTFDRGIGAWGNNTSVVWGFGIANYVWWIGIGNAGTLISSMLLLTRQKWRASINRFAETMTLFAAAMAGIFPIIHMGRPMYWYWLTPYPNTMTLWPQWRSALIWDFWAIACYITFSLVFWFLGLLPDLAAVRDRARSALAKRLYGAFALGWRGSARQWALQHRLHRIMAMLAVPLVCSVHSIVGLDFAASLMPGWSESLFPPYFVVGAMFSGFCMVVVLSAAIRWGMRLQGVITLDHFDAMAKIILAASIIMGLSYATEWFSAWYGGDPDEIGMVRFSFTGTYAGLYAGMLLFNVALPQALWARSVRRNVGALVLLAILINVGMWLERIMIIFTTLSHAPIPSAWSVFRPTLTDGALLFGSLGLFALLFLVTGRLVPLVSMSETREVLTQEGRA